jgi:hypothetical protein
MQVPVVVENGSGRSNPCIHVLSKDGQDTNASDGSNGAHHGQKWVKNDCAEKFVCVLMLTKVPVDGSAYTLVKRADGLVEKLIFPPGL